MILHKNDVVRYCPRVIRKKRNNRIILSFIFLACHFMQQRIRVGYNLSRSKISHHDFVILSLFTYSDICRMVKIFPGKFLPSKYWEIKMIKNLIYSLIHISCSISNVSNDRHVQSLLTQCEIGGPQYKYTVCEPSVCKPGVTRLEVVT